jgi:hypothetical protein
MPVPLQRRIVLGLGLLALGGAVGLVALRVHAATHPARRRVPSVAVAQMLAGVEPVGFSASDGSGIVGWWAGGRPGRAPILLCHDLGSRKEALVDLGLALHADGAPVLWFDFRGHGESAGRSSTLGLTEKRDVLGAIDFLARRLGQPPREIGLYGVGMGAHAGVLAAADRPAVRVLVLEDLYPDAGFLLAHRVWGDWDAGARYLSFAAEGLFSLTRRVPIDRPRAADTLARLTGRDVLLLAPAGDPRLAGEIERMYASIPAQRDAEGNLIVLPATHAAGLFGEDAIRHRERVVEFLRGRLGR